MNRIIRAAGVFLILAAIFVVGVQVAGAIAATSDQQMQATTSVGSTTETTTMTTSTTDAPDVDQAAARTARADLLELVDDWRYGGGETGFPFWEKAYRRWQDGEITDGAFREYVVTYRDVLLVGRDALADSDVDGVELQEIRTLLRQAISDRIAVLRELDELLQAGSGASQSISEVQDDVENAEDAEQPSRDHADLVLQRSYRATRLATNQSADLMTRLHAQPIPEGSFV